MLGRRAGQRGNFVMTEYMAREMARVGLEPGGEAGTYFQLVPMVQRSTDSTSTLTVKGERLQPSSGFALVRPSATIRFASTLAPGTYPSVYGGRAGDSTVVLPASEVSGRIVILDAPLDAAGNPTGVYSTPAAVSISRFPTAAGIAVAALDIVTPATAASLRGSGSGLSEAGVSPERRPFGFVVSADVAGRIMGGTLSGLRPGARGADITAEVRFIDRPVEAAARNVIAILRGSDPRLRGQYVAIGAHNDHIGLNPRAVDHDSLRAYNRVMRPEGAQTSAAGAANPAPAQQMRIRAILDSLRRLRPPRMDSVNNGADDDASGSVALLEIAEFLSQGTRPRRSILFVSHTAEEGGLLGSAWFTDNTTVPRDSIVAQLNMDMVGRGTAADLPRGGRRNLQVIGSRRLSTDLGNVLDSVNARSAEPFVIDYSFDAPGHPLNRYCRSDHFMYARKGIPIAYISRGYHQDYHLVTDEPQYIEYEALVRVSGFVRDVALAVANRSDRVRVDKPRPNPLAPCRQ